MASLVYMTFPDMDEALALGRRLVQKELCAGLNIIPGAVSIYRWHGEVREKRECLLIAQVARVNEFIAEARAGHSYETPCIVTLPVTGGWEPFLGWIEQNGTERGSCA